MSSSKLMCLFSLSSINVFLGCLFLAPPPLTVAGATAAQLKQTRLLLTCFDETAGKNVAIREIKERKFRRKRVQGSFMFCFVFL